jgi:hypothetical protein
MFLMLVVGIEIRERGYVTFFTFVRWDEVESYGWRYAKNVLFLRLKRRNNPVLVEKLTNPAKKDMVDRILQVHLPHGEQGIVTGTDTTKPVDQSAPAQRVRGPASQLKAVGIAVIVATLGFAMIVVGALMVIHTNSITVSTEGIIIVALVLFLLEAFNVSVGVIFLVAARRMSKLKNYRFCRGACIVAMLPLHAGCAMGLPIGIWALWVLSRPEVKAAFAANDSPRTMGGG